MTCPPGKSIIIFTKREKYWVSSQTWAVGPSWATQPYSAGRHSDPRTQRSHWRTGPRRTGSEGRRESPRTTPPPPPPRTWANDPLWSEIEIVVQVMLWNRGFSMQLFAFLDPPSTPCTQCIFAIFNLHPWVLGLDVGLHVGLSKVGLFAVGTLKYNSWGGSNLKSHSLCKQRSTFYTHKFTW